jgi:hypothetical protein
MPECPQESVIAAALAAGRLSEELHLHLNGCAVCCGIDSVTRNLLQFANGLSVEPVPSAASMWWRLNLRMRQEKARRAQKPLVWMGRISYTTITLTAATSMALIPGLSHPVAAIGLLALSAVVLPAAITLWGWSQSGI